MSNSWTPFWVDFNSYGYTLIGERADWISFVLTAERIKAAHSGPTSRMDGTVLTYLLDALAAPAFREDVDELGVRLLRPSFGYRSEHYSRVTLGTWASHHGMDLRAVEPI